MTATSARIDALKDKMLESFEALASQPMTSERAAVMAALSAGASAIGDLDQAHAAQATGTPLAASAAPGGRSRSAAAQAMVPRMAANGRPLTASSQAFPAASPVTVTALVPAKGISP